MQQRQFKLRRSGDYGRCQDMELTTLGHLLARERGNEGFCQVSDLGDITLLSNSGEREELMEKKIAEFGNMLNLCNIQMEVFINKAGVTRKCLGTVNAYYG